MSHCATVEIEFNDISVLEEACKIMGIKFERVTNYKFYDGNTVTGYAIYLPNWNYPAVLTDTGGLVYDNYNGHWGKEDELNLLKQRYGVEKTKKQLRKKGYRFSEQTNTDGKIKLTAYAR